MTTKKIESPSKETHPNSHSRKYPEWMNEPWDPEQDSRIRGDLLGLRSLGYQLENRFWQSNKDQKIGVSKRLSRMEVKGTVETSKKREWRPQMRCDHFPLWSQAPASLQCSFWASSCHLPCVAQLHHEDYKTCRRHTLWSRWTLRSAWALSQPRVPPTLNA